MSSQDQLDDLILNSLKPNDLSQYSFRVDVVPNILDQWRQNFRYALRPDNPAFVDATLSYQDILVWGYTLQYNQNGILWRVDAAGRPHPDDYSNFLEQNRVIQRATERTIVEIKSLLDTSQVSQASSESQPNPDQPNDKPYSTDKVPYIAGTELKFSAATQGSGKIDYSVLFSANRLSPKQTAYISGDLLSDPRPRPYYEGAIIHTKEGFFKVINGVDTYIAPPPEHTIYWKQGTKNPDLGLYKVVGYETIQFWGILGGGASIISRTSRVIKEVAAIENRGLTRAATVDELIEMMNKRPNVTAEYARGEALEYLQKMEAEASHMMLENGKSSILLVQDVATRRTVFHEWLHRYFQLKNGGPVPNEDQMIEQILNRLNNTLML